MQSAAENAFLNEIVAMDPVYDIAGTDDVWTVIEDRAALDDNQEFAVVSFPENQDTDRPLLILVHPGDAVQKPDDVLDCEEGDQEVILDYSMTCQEGMGREILDVADHVDLVVLHNSSSHYAFINDVGVSDTYKNALNWMHEDGVVLWGAHLDQAGEWIAKRLEAAVRPLVIVTGAWADKDHGCVTALGKHLEAKGAKVVLSWDACVNVSPDDGEAWQPQAGRFNGLDKAPVP